MIITNMLNPPASPHERLALAVIHVINCDFLTGAGKDRVGVRQTCLGEPINAPLSITNDHKIDIFALKDIAILTSVEAFYSGFAVGGIDSLIGMTVNHTRSICRHE